MHSKSLQWARRATSWLAFLAACVALLGSPLTAAQAPAAPGNAAQAPSPEELERLVAPIALYPDDLVAIILPASTNPLQIVQADRFLEKRKQDPNLQVDDRWDDSVKALVNYPDIVKQMNADLDWTADLGEAVVADQGAVLDAVQAFRRKAQAAGNLKSDDKQTVEVDKNIIQIVPANPEVIYVPQYNPTTVVVASPYPVWGYYPAPYPVYSYPYAPGAAFATGLIWGAAIGAAWHGGWGCNWSGGTINNNININRNSNNNINRGGGNRAGQLPAGGGSAWKSNKQPGQVARSAGRPTSTQRVGDARPGGASGGLGGGGGRPSTQPAGGGFNQGNAARGGVSASGAATRSGGAGANRDAFGGYASGRQTNLDSSRGAASRSSMQSGASRGSYGGGGGGGAARGGGGGGGGGRGGGGGGRGGGGGGRR